MANEELEQSERRLERIERALVDQRVFIQRVPDPDNRYRAETNLMKLLEMREQYQLSHSALIEANRPAP